MPLADSAAVQAPATAPQTAGEKPVVAAEQGARFEGFISSRFVARWTGGSEDIDLKNLVSVDWSDPRHSWIRAHVVARLDGDLNGYQAGNPFNGISDINQEAVDFKLYDAYVDILPPSGLGQLRIGRQFEAETPEIVHYDGLSFRSHPSGESEFTAGVYGGIPVRLYQDTSENRSLFGVFAEERPWKDCRARIDWMHLEDSTVPDSGNGIIGLGLWQRFEGGWSAEGQYTRLEDQDRDLRLRGQWTSVKGGLTASATYYQLFQTENELPADIDPYTSILMALYPYQQFGCSVSTEISEKVQLDLGVDARRVNDSTDQGEFNRDWERYRASTLFPSLIAAQLDLNLFGDYWDGGDRQTTAWGLDLSYDTRQKWAFGAGSYFSLYKYDMFSNSERDDVRTWYARATCKLGPKVTLEMGYDYEDDNQDQYSALRGGVVWHF